MINTARKNANLKQMVLLICRQVALGMKIGRRVSRRPHRNGHNIPFSALDGIEEFNVAKPALIFLNQLVAPGIILILISDKHREIKLEDNLYFEFPEHLSEATYSR